MELLLANGSMLNAKITAHVKPCNENGCSYWWSSPTMANFGLLKNPMQVEKLVV